MNFLKKKIRNSLVILFALLNPPAQKRTLSRIISFHDIPEKFQLEFENKIKWLKKNYNLMSLEDICRAKNLDTNKINIAITFDDGFKEQASFAAPLLQKLSIPATFFIPSGGIGANEEFGNKNLKRRGQLKFMNESDVKTLAQNPLFEIGGHTLNHIDLGKQLNREEIEKEVLKDKEKLENITGKKIKFFAYPFGGKNNLKKENAESIKNAGYSFAFTIIPSFFDTKQNPYGVGRDCLSFDDGNLLWKCWLLGGYDWLSKLKA